MIKVLARTRPVSPAIAGRSSIQVAPKMAPNPTVEVNVARPSGPRPKTLSAKPGNNSTQPRGPIVVTVKSGDRQCGNAAQIRHRHEKYDIGGGIDRKGRTDADLGDDDPGDRRSDKT